VPVLVTRIRSGFPSPFRSATKTKLIVALGPPEAMGSPKVPSPLPGSTKTLALMAVTRSSLPSPLKSPEATVARLLRGPLMSLLAKGVWETACVIGKLSELEVPPPEPGLVTVMRAVPGDAMSDAEMEAESLELLRKVVVRGLPFQLTTAEEVKPVPETVSVN